MAVKPGMKDSFEETGEILFELEHWFPLGKEGNLC